MRANACTRLILLSETDLTHLALVCLTPPLIVIADSLLVTEVAVREPPVPTELRPSPPVEDHLELDLTSAHPQAPLPPDDVRDQDMPLADAVRRAEERYPTASAFDPNTPMTLKTVFTQAVQDRFRATLYGMDDRIRAKLEQDFGKDNLLQCFHAEPALRHVLLPLWKSGCLYQDHKAWASLQAAYYPAKVLKDLLEELWEQPIVGLRGIPTDWTEGPDIDPERVKSCTAALLHFNGSVADLTRWIGGPHVGAQRDHPAILDLVRSTGLDDTTYRELERLFLSGIPAACNAESTERNFLECCLYGNHTTVDEEPEKTFKAMVKDYKKGFTLLFDPRSVLFMLDCHLTPQGVVDLNTPGKKPRPIFDSSFRPQPWCSAINDWTHKDNEPELTFASAEMGFMIWLYNLRVSYPDEEIYIADDDVSGAFRLMKYHPNLMAMHTSIQCGHAVVNTGATFGDNTSPSNFDVLGRARRHQSRAAWLSDRDVEAEVGSFLPELQTADPPTPAEVATFCPADRDELNPGVFDELGRRLPPPYHMHVDDNLYADVLAYLSRTIYSSVAGLFDILGRPTHQGVPTVLSDDKFSAWCNHLRKLVGRKFDSRRLTVGITQLKRQALSALLEEWTQRTTYGLKDIAHLLGTLENHTRCVPWARVHFCVLQNAIRKALHIRHQILVRRYNRQGREIALARELPQVLHSRIGPLIQRERALLLWTTRQAYSVTPDVMACVAHLKAYVDDTDSPWEVPIGRVIPRNPHFQSRGDASLVGGGACCPGLQFWLDVKWSPEVLTGIHNRKPSAPGYVHINALEFIVIILQLAAIKVRITEPGAGGRYFGGELPHIPVWLGETDNTVSDSWATRVSSKGAQGQGLTRVYAELLRTTEIHTTTRHLAGKLNVVADDISRNDFSLPPHARVQRIHALHPSLEHYEYFLPSAELGQHLFSHLFSGPSTEPYVLPPVLGRFLPASSTDYGTFTI